MSSYTWDEESTRSLINLVQANPAFYAKGARMFKDKQAKELGWETVGACVTPVPCKGEIAPKKKLNALRDTFVKEHRRITEANDRPSGSGGGGGVPSHSTWEFYYDLLFLKEHLGAKKTTTNILKRPASTNVDIQPKRAAVTVGMVQAALDTLRPAPTATQSLGNMATRLPGTSVLVTDSSSPGTAAISQDDSIYCPVVDDTFQSDLEVREIFSESNLRRTMTSTPATTSSSSTPTGSQSDGGYQSVRAKAAAFALKVPPADMPRRKPKDHNKVEALKALDRLNSTAMAVMDKIEKKTSSNSDDDGDVVLAWANLL